MACAIRPCCTAINLTKNALEQSIFGNAGSNRLNGRGGDDVLTGGLGADVFVFQDTVAADNIDKINDYTVADDQIELHASAFTGLVPGGLAPGAFTANANGAATLGSHCIVYETDTGFLWFDADGNGAGARVQFADLAGGLAMPATEFSVV